MASELPKLKVSNEQMRTLVLEHLASNEVGQLNDLYRSIANLAVDRGFHDGPKADPIGARYGGKAPDTYYRRTTIEERATSSGT